MIGPIGWEEFDGRQTDDRRQTTDTQTNEIPLYQACFAGLIKVHVQFPHILVLKLHTQACEIVAGTKRKLYKKFQVDICKTKKDRSPHALLRTL